VISKCWQNIIAEHTVVYVISQLIIIGGRKITQEGSKILPKIFPKVLVTFSEIL